jgi:DNA-directed RNA polymerase subunit M/transcription elongation factor TFIIS
MKFCPDCENALTDIRDDGAGVGFECRKCKYNEKITRANPLVYEHNLNQDTAARLVVNPYLSLDPTLPRFSTIQCPTDGCKSKEVVGVKVDSKNIVWMYQCTLCGVSWKQDARRS